MLPAKEPTVARKLRQVGSSETPYQRSDVRGCVKQINIRSKSKSDLPPVGRVSALDDYFGTCDNTTAVTAKVSDEAETKKTSSGNPPAAFGQRGDSGGSSNRLTQKSLASPSPAASPTTEKKRKRRSPEISVQIAEEDTKIVTTAAMTSSCKEDGEDTSAVINVLNYNENFRSAAIIQDSPSASPNFKPFYSNRNIKSDSHIIGKGVSVDEVENEQDNN